ncbi:hypothetical protein NPIL_273431 [Nephila pilipes]|uniref:Uncharacterized protein n=1 Tax=Nephila pilipes TaxID=299642 RepID=A0A8X6U681_NEPPI|nr:hypothetical protein NPIL_273431 [Nephila pilipes]
MTQHLTPVSVCLSDSLTTHSQIDRYQPVSLTQMARSLASHRSIQSKLPAKRQLLKLISFLSGGISLSFSEPSKRNVETLLFHLLSYAPETATANRNVGDYRKGLAVTDELALTS